MRWSHIVIETSGCCTPCSVCGRTFPDSDIQNGDVMYFPDSRTLTGEEDDLIRRVWGLDPYSEFVVCEACRNHDHGAADWLDAGDWLRRREKARPPEEAVTPVSAKLTPGSEDQAVGRDEHDDRGAPVLRMPDENGAPERCSNVGRGELEVPVSPVEYSESERGHMEAIQFDPALEAVKRAFCMGLTMGAITVEIDGQTRPWRWVLEELEFCEDELPDRTCDLIGVERGMTYAQAVESWWISVEFKAYTFPKLLEDPSLSPESRAFMQVQLDWVYLMTGWERPTPGNG